MAGDLLIEKLQRPGLAPIDLRVPAGQTVCLHGDSGSGKTLLLRAIADLDPNQGEVKLGAIAREQISAHQWRHQVGYLAPTPAWWADTARPHCAQWSSKVLAQLDLPNDILDWTLARLSSGEKQRLALARLLNREPDCLLLDEATANLDPDNTARVETLIERYREQHQCPVLWVSHDHAQRERIADRIVRIQGGALQ